VVRRPSNFVAVGQYDCDGNYVAQINRFYTKEFFREANDVLKNRGIITFSAYSNPNYMSREQVQLYLTLKKTLEEVFEDVKITPGETNYFLASNEKDLITLDWRVLMETLNKRNIKAQYMREYYLFSELSRDRIDSFNRRIDKVASEPDIAVCHINRDFHPIAYYYDMVLWTTYFKYNLKKLFRSINARRIYVTAAVLYIILLIPIFVKKIADIPHVIEKIVGSIPSVVITLGAGDIWQIAKQLTESNS